MKKQNINPPQKKFLYSLVIFLVIAVIWGLLISLKYNNLENWVYFGLYLTLPLLIAIVAIPTVIFLELIKGLRTGKLKCGSDLGEYTLYKKTQPFMFWLIALSYLLILLIAPAIVYGIVTGNFSSLNLIYFAFVCFFFIALIYGIFSFLKKRSKLKKK